MAETLREVIKKTISYHLKKRKGLVFGQCLTAVGWVGGTLPKLGEKDGLVDLSMADVANGGIVAGAGLSNRRPIYVIRYQGFNWFNAPIILNYSCKSKEIWNTPCPIFIRGIAMEGSIGPVAGSSHYSIYYKMPGIKIISPMTPKEYKYTYKHFMKNDDVLYVSEHRKSYDNKEELNDIIPKKCDLIIFAISITRFDALVACNKLKKMGYNVGIANILWIKPFKVKSNWIKKLSKAKYGGLVIDDDYTSGIAESIAYKLMHLSNKKVSTLGLKDRSAGFSKKTDNLPPKPKDIIKKILDIIKNN
tara:strand:+ start:118 stop:1029 length:912 start_codon:yes stop_codon:yes gene_type:complete